MVYWASISTITVAIAAVGTITTSRDRGGSDIVVGFGGLSRGRRRGEQETGFTAVHIIVTIFH